MFGRANILVVTFRFFLESLMHLLRKELQLKDNCPFDNYRTSDKYLKVQFLKTRDAMSKKKLKEKNAFEKTITTFYCQNIP